MWDWHTRTTTQVTTPPPGLVVPDHPELGHELTDYTPAWSPDGKSIAYVRLIGAGTQDALYPTMGGNVRIVSLTGAGSRLVTTMYGEQLFMALSWGGDPDGQTHLVGRHASTSAGAITLLDIDPQSGATTPVVRASRRPR